MKLLKKSNFAMKLLKVCLLCICVVIICFIIILRMRIEYISFAEDSPPIGKEFTETIPEEDIVDAEYMKRVLNNEVDKNKAYFNLLGEETLKNLIIYMDINDYVIVPGTYTLNQAWDFKDGVFLIQEVTEEGTVTITKKEVIKFQKK